MADPFTPAFIAANCAWAVARGLTGQAGVALGRRIFEAVRDRRSPEEEELLKATHRAFVRSMWLMAEVCGTTGGNTADQFSAMALAKAAKDPELIHFDTGSSVLPKKELDERMRAMFTGAGAASGEAAADLVVAEIEKRMGHPLTAVHRELFRQGNAQHGSWANAFELFFTEEVKSNERIFRSLAFDRLNEIAAAADSRSVELVEANRRLAAFTSTITAGLGRLQESNGEVRPNQSAQEASLNRIQSTLDRLVARLNETALAAHGRAAGIQPEAYVELARRINKAVDSEEQAFHELTRAVERLLALGEAAGAGTNLGQLVHQALRQIDQRARFGDFDGSAKAAEEAFSDWEKGEAERQREQREGGLRLIQANIEQQILRRDPVRAANWVERRLALEAGIGTAPLESFAEEFEKWYVRGRDKGLNFDLEVATEIGRKALGRLQESVR